MRIYLRSFTRSCIQLALFTVILVPSIMIVGLGAPQGLWGLVGFALLWSALNSFMPPVDGEISISRALRALAYYLIVLPARVAWRIGLRLIYHMRNYDRPRVVAVNYVPKVVRGKLRRSLRVYSGASRRIVFQ